MTDFSFAEEAVVRAAREFETLAQDLRRPFNMIKPRVFRDGDQWCALHGDDIQIGVCGFGDSPDAAAYDFDRAWHETTKAEGSK